MKNIERFIRNETHYDERYYGDHEMTLTIKENPSFYLHMWDGYLDNIFHNNLRTLGDYWIGFTRDNQEFIRTYSGDVVEIENIDEYITDLLLYKNVDFQNKCFKETKEVYELILDFLTFAKENNLTVLAEYE